MLLSNTPIPFSPYKNSECWTFEFFSEEKRILKKDGIISTYSMSTPVRSAMFQAGLFVYEGIGDGTKTTGTIASSSSNNKLTRLPKKMTEKLVSSPDRIPFRDFHLNALHEDIKKIRRDKKDAQDYSDIERINIDY